jgi:oligopeptide transport system ATP-binding protein
MASEAVLDVRDLTVGFRKTGDTVEVVRGVSFKLAAGETLALVGESGSGKSVTSLALMQLTPPPPRTTIKGSARLLRKSGETVDLVGADAARIRSLRGNDIAMIFQEPMTSLNPVQSIGDQITETLHFHRTLSRRDARDEAVRLLDVVGIPDAARRLGAYPHELSGGMRQRVMIAIAISCEPQVLIADEPTTALDVTVQAQILRLLKSLQEKTGMAMIFITHNMGVVSEIADRVMVLYAGRLVEQGPAAGIFANPLMPYTRGLLRSIPTMEMAGCRDVVLEPIPGSAPDPSHMPSGCSFHPRCWNSRSGVCDRTVPIIEQSVPGHDVRCVRWRELAANET